MLKVPLRPPNFACVVAADEARGIGKDNALPWPKLPKDLEHFKQVTTATDDPGKRNAVIMGRLTWESLPSFYRPLPGRVNLVVSRAARDVGDGAQVVASLDAAIEAAIAPDLEQVFVGGGAQIFTAAVRDPRCAVIYYTRIEGRFECDAHFPAFEDDFTRVAQSERFTSRGPSYVIERWARIPRSP